VCVSFFRAWRKPVLLTEAVVTEATHLLGRVPGGALAILRFVLDRGAVLVPCPGGGGSARCWWGHDPFCMPKTCFSCTVGA